MENDAQIFFYVTSVLSAIITIYVATELGCKKILIPIGLLIVLIFSFRITEQKFILQSLLFSCFIVMFFIYPFTKIKLTETVIPIITSIIAISIISNLIFYIFNIYFNTFNDKMFPVISELSQDDKPGVLAVLLNKIGLLDDSQEKFGVLGDLRDKFGVLGDFFGGIFNPILTFASLILLLGTFFINLKELKETREEMKKQSEQMKEQSIQMREQTKLTRKQTIDAFYFELIKRHDNLLYDATKEYDNVFAENRSCPEARKFLNEKSIFINYAGQLSKALLFIEENKDYLDKKYYPELLNIFQNQKILILIAISYYGQENSHIKFNKEHRELVKSSFIKKDENIFFLSLFEAKKQKPPIRDQFIISLLVDYEIKIEFDDNLIKKSRAIIKFAQVSEQSADDLLSLGCLYYLGEEISEDYEKAFYYFKKSNQLNPNNDITKFWLANCYLRGDGVQKSLNEANALYGQIKDSQNSNTKPRLKELAQKLYQQTKLQEITLSSVGDSSVFGKPTIENKPSANIVTQPEPQTKPAAQKLGPQGFDSNTFLK